MIGAGFGGLSSAALLAKDGHKVEVFEKNDMAGGRARVWKKDGFVFDMGPSWYLMPDVFERFFKEFGKKPEDYYRLKHLDPQYRMYFGKEDRIDISRDISKNVELFDSLERDGGKKLKKYLELAKIQYEVAMDKFVYKNYNSLFDFFNWEIILNGPKMRLFSSLDNYTRRFFSNPKARKILLYTTVFLGGSPKKTPALYSLMSHVDFNLGVSYPDGGLGSLVSAFERVCKEQGVLVHYNSPVEKILVDSAGKARKLLVNGEEKQYDVVVANADYNHVETELLDRKWQTYDENYWRKKIIAPSAFIIYLGIKKKLKQLLHHTLILSNDWMGHFESIFDRPSWPGKPSYYVCCPSKTDDSVAPQGHENLFILVPAAAGLKDSDEFRERYAKKILSHLEESIGERFIDDITVKRIFTHRDFQEDYNAFKGTALGLAHTLFQTAVFRPGNQSRRISNLYYAGHFTNPGIGVPMVVISAHLVRELIRRQHGKI